MTNPNLTDITLVVDRSGSMQRILEDAQGSIRAFIEDQRNLDAGDEVRLTFVHFDDQVERLHERKPIADVPAYDLHPRNMTALYDAVGSTINWLGERYAELPEDERPGKVLVAIITDGLENASHEFTKDDVQRLITRQSVQYGWEFVFLGAGIDAMAEGRKIGIPAMNTQSVRHQSYGAGGQSLNSYAASYRQTGTGTWGDVDEEDKLR